MNQIQRNRGRVERIDPSDSIEVGQWYWVDEDDDKLCCVVELGSNYALLRGPSPRGSWSFRVHFDEFWDRCVLEPNAEDILAAKIAEIQDTVNGLLGRARELTKNLSVPDREGLPEPETRALARLNSNLDPNAYKRALVKAKDETLPDIFKQIKAEHTRLERYMKAGLEPMKGDLASMQAALSRINDRIFSIDLYAGLSEEVVQIAEGEPAPYEAKVHIMQRRLYMDEECLLRYKAGGMEFSDIGQFDAWLAEPENLERIMPFDRCLVAFRVRRKMKDRYGKEFNSPLGVFIKMRLEDADKRTFMYFRNGDRLYRMSTQMQFPEKLFGDDSFELAEVMWARCSSSGRVEDVIPGRLYEQRLQDHMVAKVEMDAFKEAHPDFSRWNRPGGESDEFEAWDELRKERYAIDRRLDGQIENYVEFTPDTVYFDDIKRYVNKKVVERNRIALIMQGLFDRSPVYHPHPPVELWSQKGFNAAVKLVYDDDRALYGQEEPPDFEAFRRRCNESLETGSVTYGQQSAWRRHMVERYDNDDRRWRTADYDFEKIPYGDPGPGSVARVEHYHPRAEKCRFRWKRRKRSDYAWNEFTPAVFTCPQEKLLNLDGYSPGDYLQFFEDPRTRADYLKWAPYLLTAEDYHAGKLRVREPNIHPDEDS